jgi:DNA modification methylase
MNETKLIHGDCLEKLKELPDCSVDSIVTDPPYGLSFMGKKWDYDVPSVEVWAECLRVLKPGGHLLAFAGTRTQHRMAVRIEDAGLEIRDMIAWVYGSGFPKSLDVSKAIDKAAGAKREVIGQTKANGIKAITKTRVEQGYRKNLTIANERDIRDITAPATDSAKQWHGWGTALKPALEPITVARKPLAGTVADNVLEHGTGALNVDGCRVGTEGGTTRSEQAPYAESGWRTGHKIETLNAGRWPANLIHDGSEEVAGLLGEAARFFYCAKTNSTDRNEGCEKLLDKEWALDGACIPERGNRPFNPSKNNHPTVKPTNLMRYLCRLVTPPNGVVLDPFMGSGSTGKAAMLEGFNFIGIEREESYMEIAEARINLAKTPA